MRATAAIVLALGFAALGGCGPGETTRTVEYCYKFTCDGEATGEQCFDTRQAYCDALCSEPTCSRRAESNCESDCDQSYSG